jgi:hypothetical protein
MGDKMAESIKTTGGQQSTSVSTPVPYQYRTSEFGFFAEIYLPKRAEYQGVLHDALVGGFKFQTKVIKEHFEKEEIAKRVLQFLEHYQDIKKIIESERDPLKSLKNIKQTLFGYSMYEVDGVFWSEERQRAIEERTLVIRLMFVPRDFQKQIERINSSEEYKGYNFQLEYSDAIDYARRYLAAYKREANMMKEGAKSAFDEKVRTGWQHLIRIYVDEWVRDAAIFTFGYLLFQICEHIGKLLEPEEEIWVTSFWNLYVNKVIKTEIPSDCGCYIMQSLGIEL